MLHHRYATELPDAGTRIEPTPLSDPRWVLWNDSLADEMGLPTEPDDDWLKVMAGQGLLNGQTPFAQKYAGHQFGGWNPDLGDGRGLLLGDWQRGEKHWELHLKGAGKTPYSRFGDGRAVLRSSLREFLGSEALHALGIPTTRALGLISSSEPVQREELETAATVMRVTESHLRFGHFEWFAFSDQPEALKALIEFALRHHFPECQAAEDPVVALFEQVAQRTAYTIAGWMAYGFVHGVMNTDNMSLLGETFDYGPYAFMDRTNITAVFNHTDQGGRYAFHRQPAVGLWNLQRLAHALSAATDAQKLLPVLQQYESQYESAFCQWMGRRFGLTKPMPLATALAWQELLVKEGKDYHLAFRALADSPSTEWEVLKDEWVDRDSYLAWLGEFFQHAEFADASTQQKAMQSTNPCVVARTHHLQAVIKAAQQEDFEPANSLYRALINPFDIPKDKQWQQAPETDRSPILSCSS